MSPRGGWQRWRAMTRASMHSPALRCSAIDQPTISRVARSRQVVAAVRGFGFTPPATAGLQTHVTHQPLDPASRMSVPFPAQLSMDPGRAVDPALGRKDAADMPAQLGFRLSAALSGRDRAQPRVEAADTRT